METSSFAFTRPQVLVTPRISRTTGASSRTPAVPPPTSLSVIPGYLLRAVGDLDVAVDDTLPRVVDLVLDVLGNVAVEAAERREAYALIVQPELDDLAARERPAAGLLYRLVDGVVHPLDHGGQDGGVGERSEEHTSELQS